MENRYVVRTEKNKVGIYDNVKNKWYYYENEATPEKIKKYNLRCALLNRV